MIFIKKLGVSIQQKKITNRFLSTSGIVAINTVFSRIHIYCLRQDIGTDNCNEKIRNAAIG